MYYSVMLQNTLGPLSDTEPLGIGYKAARAG